MEGDLITQLGQTCQSDGTGFDPYATSTVTIHNVRFTSKPVKLFGSLGGGGDATREAYVEVLADPLNDVPARSQLRATPRTITRAPRTHCQNCQNTRPPRRVLAVRLGTRTTGRREAGFRKGRDVKQEAGPRLRGASIGSAKKPTNLDSSVQGA